MALTLSTVEKWVYDFLGSSPEYRNLQLIFNDQIHTKFRKNNQTSIFKLIKKPDDITFEIIKKYCFEKTDYVKQQMHHIENASKNIADVLKSETKDPIKPNYYKDSTGRDAIDVINDFGLNFNTGSAFKYMVRAGKKDPTKHVQDLKKALECISREIQIIERKQSAITNE